MSIVDNLKGLDDDDLASRIVGLKRETRESLLAKWEWERRKAKAQHEFNMTLLDEQARLARRNLRIAIIGSIIATLLGAFAGAILSFHLQ